MINKLAAKGRKLVNVVDPHLRKDDDYKCYRETKDHKRLVKDKNSDDYEGWCWPGSQKQVGGGRWGWLAQLF